MMDMKPVCTQKGDIITSKQETSSSYKNQTCFSLYVILFLIILQSSVTSKDIVVTV
jgi:hypothetical protein